MDVILMIGGILVPALSAIVALGAWFLPRMDRRFDEAALDRRRIEIQLGERFDRLAASFKANIQRLEAEFKARSDRIEERCYEAPSAASRSSRSPF